MQKRFFVFACLLAIVVPGLYLITGCAGYGTSSYNRHDQDRLAEMMRRFDDYRVFYSGMSEAFPAGLVFDPKDDGKTIARKKWVKVDNRDLLEKLVRKLERYHNYPPRLYTLKGEDGRVYGYIYTVYRQGDILVRQVDEDRIHVREMGLPPHLKYDPDGFSGGKNPLTLTPAAARSSISTH